MWPLQILRRIESKLDAVLYRLSNIERKENQMSAELDALQGQVAANTDAEQSAVLLLGKLHDLIVAAGTDPAALKKLTDDLAASKDALAASIVANTPAESAPKTTKKK
jgi:hypothetical protein